MNKRYFRVSYAVKDLRPYHKLTIVTPFQIYSGTLIIECENEAQAAAKVQDGMRPHYQWLWTEVTESDMLSFMMATTFSGDKTIRVLSPLNNNIHLK